MGQIRGVVSRLRGGERGSTTLTLRWEKGTVRASLGSKQWKRASACNHQRQTLCKGGKNMCGGGKVNRKRGQERGGKKKVLPKNWGGGQDKIMHF